MSESVELSFFDDKSFMLTAVDKSQKSDDGANKIVFTLDGVTYEVMEDEDDDYRSYMRCINILAEIPSTSTIIPEHRVTARRREGEPEVIELIDATTLKDVLAFGTANADDYYPCFVDEYNPENLAANAK